MSSVLRASVAAVLVAALAGCGETRPVASSTSADDAVPTSSSVASSAKATQLDAAALERATIGLSELPTGWSIKPAAKTSTTTTSAASPLTSCLPPGGPKANSTGSADRELERGSGFGMSIGRLTLAQYKTAADAQEALGALRKALTACAKASPIAAGGDEMTLTEIAAPKLGDEAAAARIKLKLGGGQLFIVRSGQALTVFFCGGLGDTPGDEVHSILKAQVDKYGAAVKAAA